MSGHAAAFWLILIGSYPHNWDGHAQLSDWIFPRTAFTLTFAAWVSGTHGPQSVIGGIRENWNLLSAHANAYYVCTCTKWARREKKKKKKKEDLGGNENWYVSADTKGFWKIDLIDNYLMVEYIIIIIISDCVRFSFFFPPKIKPKRLRTVPTGNRFRTFLYCKTMVSQYVQ